jgi:DNA-binding winged helix-turn-helix (wHTH) protein
MLWPAPSADSGTTSWDRRSLELRKSGQKVKLAPQPARVLALLASRPGELVTRDEIRREIWGDGTFVDFGRNLNFCLNSIRAVLGDTAQSPRFVETLPRRGYRFIAPVERRRPFAEPTLAVLPFASLNSDPGKEYFADGITDALITELARIQAVRVISRQSVLHLKGSDRKLDEIARDLSVDGVVEGAVLHEGDRVRGGLRRPRRFGCGFRLA